MSLALPVEKPPSVSISFASVIENHDFTSVTKHTQRRTEEEKNCMRKWAEGGGISQWLAAELVCSVPKVVRAGEQQKKHGSEGDSGGGSSRKTKHKQTQL